jgi:hypothetical protein
MYKINITQTQHKMEHIVYLPNESTKIRTKLGELLNLNGRIGMIETKTGQQIYFKISRESLTTISGFRLQQDQYNNKKFYVTDEENEWHVFKKEKQALTKGRGMVVYN